MMGAGKSAVGRAIARRLDWRYVDLDEAIERAQGSSVAEMFQRRGEEAFRAEETRRLAEVLEEPPPLVVAAGGGVVVDPANRARLASSATVVWLRARPATLARRVGDAAGRPLLSGAGGRDLEERLAALCAQREGWYRESADVVVDVDDLGLDEVVARVLAGAGVSGEAG